ncbi:O-antigen ligase family protein [Paenibacillus chibensis]|uniref:O-antigen ligase family protein n=2 Tax=Paenibacillus chibensis TaxID=59846 RepID=UPI003530DE22
MKIIAVYSLFNSFLGVFQYIFNRSFLLFSTSENINYYEGAVVSKRVFGFVGASNGAGNLGAILFSVLLYYFIKKRNFLSLSALLMNLVFVLLTFTRIGYLSICIQMLVYLVSSHKGNIHHWLKRCLIGIATILAAFIAFQVFYKDIYQVLFVDRGDTQSNRFSQFSEAIIVMKDHPWFGIGAGQYVSYVENHYGLEDIVLHSQFLNILIEQGIFSFALFLLIYFLLFIWSLKVYKGEAWFPVSLMLGNFITVNFNPNQYYSICIYTFFILAYGMIFLGKSDDRNEAELDRRLALFNENFTRFPGTATLPNRWSNEILPGSNADTARIDA